MASNAFVIHGNHTESGHPYLANDPHLGASLPSVWHLAGIHIGDDYVIGAALPGVPLIAQGTTKYISFGSSTPLTDTSDIYRERLNDKQTQYYVDGQWRDLKVIKETINVKG